MNNNIFLQQGFPYLTKLGFEIDKIYIDNNYFIYTHPCGIPICLEWEILKNIYLTSEDLFNSFQKLINNIQNDEVENKNFEFKYNDEIKNIFEFQINNKNEELSDIIKKYSNITYLDWNNINKSKRYPYCFEIFNQYGYYRQDTSNLILYITQSKDIQYLNSIKINMNEVVNIADTIKSLCKYKWTEKRHILLCIYAYEIYNREITYTEKLKWY